MKKNSEINFWKFFFALVIMFFHTYFWMDNGRSPVFPTGALAVEFFFIVSGYLTAGTVISGRCATPWSLLSHKVKSLILPFWCAWLLNFAVRCVVGQKHFSVVAKELFESVFELLFLRNAGFKGVYINGVTWYISALLISTALICVPLYRSIESSPNLEKTKIKATSEYIYIWAPVIAVLILGYLSHEYDSLLDVDKWNVFAYKCQLRAIAEVNLGVFVFGMREKLDQVRFTKVGKIFLSLTEVVCYLTAVLYMQFAHTSGKDFVVVLIFAVAVCLSFSGRTYLYELFDRIPVITEFMGKMSLYMYLSHMLWIKTLPILWKGALYSQLLILYVPAALITAFLLMRLVDLLYIKGLPKLGEILIEK